MKLVLIWVTSCLGMSEVHLGKDVFLLPYSIGKEYGYEVEIVHFEPDASENPEPYFHRGVKIVPLSGKNPETACAEYLRNNAAQIDMLMLLHLRLANHRLAMMYKRLNPRGKVLLKSDLYYKGTTEAGLLKKFLKKAVLNRLNKSVDLFSVETVVDYNVVLANGLYGVDISDKLTYLSNGFDGETLTELEIAKKPFSQKENLIITVGRLGTAPKNTELLLRAIDGMDLQGKEAWRIILIGTVEPDFERKLDGHLQRNPGQKDRLVMTGNISDKIELFDYYNRAKVFVFTSDRESYGVVLNEAAAFGNYIISTDVGGIRDVTDDGKLGVIIDVGDEDALRTELSAVINGKEIGGASHAVREFAEQNLDWASIVSNNDKLRALIER